MEGVAGPNVLASNNFFFSFSDQKYLTGPSDLAKQLLLINRDERPLYCNNPGSWFKAQQIFLTCKFKLKLEPTNNGSEFLKELSKPSYMHDYRK